MQLYVAAPVTYPESTGAPDGAGHCNFSDAQRVALAETLDDWVHEENHPVQAGLTRSFGVGPDPAYAAVPSPADPNA